MESIRLHQNLDNILNISLNVDSDQELYIIGDLHGQFEDFIQILNIIDAHSDGSVPKQLLFLGDIVDRGLQSVETLLSILVMQQLWPDRVFLIRGNHETEQISRLYGFYDECCRKNLQTCYSIFLQLFQTLPIAVLIEMHSLNDKKLAFCSQNAEMPQKGEKSAIFPEHFYGNVYPKTQVNEAHSGLAKHSLQINFQESSSRRSGHSFTESSFRKIEFGFCREASAGAGADDDAINQHIQETSVSKPPQQEFLLRNSSPNHLQSPLSSTSNKSETNSLSSTYKSISLHSNNVIRRIYCAHGGISEQVTSLSELDLQIRAFNDFGDEPEQRAISDVLWSDPSEEWKSFHISQRNKGRLYGIEAVYNFLKTNDVQLIIRAHQWSETGFKHELDDRVITVWSAANYEQRCGNTGALMLIKSGQFYYKLFKKVFVEGDRPPIVQVDYFL